jgi:hypothetical protein
VVKQTVDGKLTFDAHYVKDEPHFPAKLPRGLTVEYADRWFLSSSYSRDQESW